MGKWAARDSDELLDKEIVRYTLSSFQTRTPSLPVCSHIPHSKVKLVFAQVKHKVDLGQHEPLTLAAFVALLPGLCPLLPFIHFDGNLAPATPELTASFFYPLISRLRR